MSNIKDLPAEDRPYEKCMEYGPGSLSDSELLAIILRNGMKGSSALELARRILNNETRLYQGLLSLHHLSFEELTEIPGIGPIKAVQLQCIVELSYRMAALSAEKNLSFSDPDTIADYYMERMRHYEKEHLLCLMLDTRLGLIKEHTVSTGTVSETIISPREIFLDALRCNAVNIILLHNHPSGDPMPSGEDIQVTRAIFELGELLNVHLLDHIVIGNLCHVSMKKEKLF